MLPLLTSFAGRIPRSQFWLGVAILFIAMIFAAIIVGRLFGPSQAGRVVMLLISLGVLYPAAALATKRLADQGKPPMPRLAIYFAPGALFSIIDTFRIGYRSAPEIGPMHNGAELSGMEMMHGGDMLVPGPFAMSLAVVSMVVTIWALVELGALRGRSGDSVAPPAG